ncbi:MAG: phosphodiester glycosidase family protein [Clostridia bacterium]|nr:phosphodiester glycosidase family protein [Clostridia bacterium]
MKKRIFSIITTAVLLLSMVPPVFAAYPVMTVTKKESTPLSKSGAVYTKYTGTYKEYKQLAYTVSAPLTEKLYIDVADGGTVYGAGRQSSDLKKQALPQGDRIIGGINADFFSLSTGIPLGIQIKDGELYATNNAEYDRQTGRHSIGFTKDGKAVIGVPDISITVNYEGGTLSPERLGSYPHTNFVILSEHYSDKSYWSNIPHDVAIIKADGALKIGCEITGSFDSFIQNVKNPIPLKSGYYYLITPAEYTLLDSALGAMEKGAPISIGVTENTGLWQDVNTAVGGGDLLVKDGKVCNPAGFDESISKSLTSRSAIGIKSDGSVIFFAAERDKDAVASIGMSLDSVAQMLADMGCLSAVNLDGGGSTTICAAEENISAVTRNSPQGGTERAVANSLILVLKDERPKVLEDFEEDGNGDKFLSGSRSLRIDYDAKSGGIYNESLTDRIDLTELSYISVAVRGDSSGGELYALYESGYGEIAQKICTLDFDGWQRFDLLSDVASYLKGFRIRNNTGKDISGILYIDSILEGEVKDSSAPVITADKNVFTLKDGIQGSGIDTNEIKAFVDGKQTDFIYKDGKVTVSATAPSVIRVEVSDVAGNRNALTAVLSEGSAKMPFEDTPEGRWDSGYIRVCEKNGYISGYLEDGKRLFRGGNNITREEYCTLLVCRAGLDITKYQNVKLPYEDIDTIGTWALPYVRAAFAEKIMVGSDGNFLPKESVTRAEATVAVCKITLIDERFGTDKVYTDEGDIPTWASDFIRTATAQGIINGDVSGSFRPNGTLSRSEAAVIMTRLKK